MKEEIEKTKKGITDYLVLFGDEAQQVMQEAFEYLKDIKNDKTEISANKYASILSSKLRQIQDISKEYHDLYVIYHKTIR